MEASNEDSPSRSFLPDGQSDPWAPQNGNHESRAGKDSVLRRTKHAFPLKTDELGQSEEGPEEDKEHPKKKKTRLAFGVEDKPPLHITIFYAFQIILSNLPGTVTAVFIVHRILCGGRDYVFLAQLMSSAVAMTGVATFLQVFLGVRLPIAQGSSFVFFPPLEAMMLARVTCPTDGGSNGTSSEAVYDNQTSGAAGEPPWRTPVLEASGGLVAASLVQVFLGFTGIIGLLTNVIGPLTVAPTIMLIGFGLFQYGVYSAQHQWGVTFLFIVLLVLFSTVLADVQVPMVTWSRLKGVHVERYPLVRMFANLLAIAVCWVLCYILTVTGRLTDDPNEVGYLARTDAKLEAVTKTSWFYFPYPGHFGAPTFGAAIFVGVMAATLSSTVESIGDYYATARICEVPIPPKHAMNRGIAMEGVASILGGLVGTCHGTTSYSNIIGFIAYTGVASRWTMMVMSVILVICAIFGKLAGALATIPEPIIGGAITVGLGLVIIVGMSQLHAVDLEATRNQMVLGLALMLGVMLPFYIEKFPDALHTGSVVVDQVLIVFLRTGPFVGGAVGLVMDNILPGTREERGMARPLPVTGEKPSADQDQTYQLPFCAEPLRRFTFFSYFPILPCYVDRPWPCHLSCPCRKKPNDALDEQVQYSKDTSANKTIITVL